MKAQRPISEFQNVVNLISLLAVLVIGGLIADLSRSPGLRFQYPLSGPQQQPRQFAQLNPAVRHEAQERFDQGVALLHAKRYDYAVTALTRVVELVPNMPEAYVNLGFALLGQEQYEQAGEYFNQATVMRPNQANAYWGLANALEGMQDYEGALGAMRSYIHLSQAGDPFVVKARAALWEYEARLGRIKGVTIDDKNQFTQVPQTAVPPQGAAGAQDQTGKAAPATAP